MPPKTWQRFVAAPQKQSITLANDNCDAQARMGMSHFVLEGVEQGFEEINKLGQRLRVETVRGVPDSHHTCYTLYFLDGHGELLGQCDVPLSALKTALRGAGLPHPIDLQANQLGAHAVKHCAELSGIAISTDAAKQIFAAMREPFVQVTGRANARG